MYTSLMLLGFVGGFVGGTLLNVIFLSGRKKSEVLEGGAIKSKYGLMTWGIAIALAFLGFIIENQALLTPTSLT